MANSKRGDIYVELTEPCHPSTRLGPTANLSGFVIAPTDIDVRSREHFNLQVLLREKGSVESRARCWRSLPTGALVENRGAFVENLEVVESRRADLPVVRLPSQKCYLVTGRINCEALVPLDSEGVKEFVISLAISCGDIVSSSNSVEIAIMPRCMWREPLGGFIFPPMGLTCSDFIAVQGWALCQGAKLSSVKVFVNDSFLEMARLGIWSPGIHLALPDPEESRRAIFASMLEFSQVKRLVPSLRASSNVCISTECTFSTGQRICFSLPNVQWRPWDKELGDGIEGEIERVYLGADGAMHIEGWVYSKVQNGLRLYLQGLRRTFEVTHAPDRGCSLVWCERPDIEERYLPRSLATSYGFSISVIPSCLDRFGGLVRLFAKDVHSDLATPLGPREKWLKISRLVIECSRFKGPGKKALAQGALCATRIIPSFRSCSSAQRLRACAGKPSSFLFATHNLSDVEGAPKVMFDIVKGVLQSCGSEARVFVISPCDGAARRSYEMLGARVEVIPDLSTVGQDWKRYTKGLVDASGIISDFSVDIIFANVTDSFWAVDVADRLSIRSVWMIHESYPPYDAFIEMDPRLRVRFLHSLRLPEKVVFVSQFSRSVYAKLVDDERAMVVPNGIDTEAIEEISRKLGKGEARKRLMLNNDEKVISIIGTTSYHKGQDIFIREMGLLKRLMLESQFRFLIVGCRDGEYLTTLKNMASDLGLSGEVIFVDATPDVAPYFIASDCVVIASREESAPLVSLEAFSYGTPLVSTTAMGLSEQVRDGENALGFNPEEEGHLAAQVVRILGDKNLRERLVRRAKEIVREGFLLRDAIRRHVEIIMGA